MPPIWKPVFKIFLPDGKLIDVVMNGRKLFSMFVLALPEFAAINGTVKGLEQTIAVFSIDPGLLC